MKYFVRIMICCMVTVIIYGCDHSERVEIIRLDRAAAAGETVTAENYAGILLWQGYCGANGEDTDSFWTQYCGSEAMRVFYPDVVERIDGALPEIETDLGNLKERLNKEFPEINFPGAIYGIVSPYMQSVMLSDSVLLIALNHYLGENYPGYEGMPVEQRVLKSPENIKIDVGEALLRTQYPFSGNEWSKALSKIAYEGAIAVSVREITDCSAPEAIGTSGENYRLLEEHEREIWKKMIESHMIFNTSPRISDELIKPFPAKKFPSRAGKYFGYKIAELAQKNGMSVSELLSPEFYMSDDVVKWYR